MKFYLVDRIESIEPGKRIATVKSLSLAEEYLADHFPAFPVMPGVLMVEAMVQSAAWLVRIEQDFAKSIVVLSSAKNVRYGSFVQPGKMFRCEVEAISIDDGSAKFKATGFVVEPGGESTKAVSARLELRCYNLADEKAHLADADRAIVADLRKQFALVGGPEAMQA